jgi:hypothetical protein
LGEKITKILYQKINSWKRKTGLKRKKRKEKPCFLVIETSLVHCLVFFGDKKLGIYIGKFWVSSVNSTNVANFCFRKLEKEREEVPYLQQKNS